MARAGPESAGPETRHPAARRKVGSNLRRHGPGMGLDCTGSDPQRKTRACGWTRRSVRSSSACPVRPFFPSLHPASSSSLSRGRVHPAWVGWGHTRDLETRRCVRSRPGDTGTRGPQSDGGMDSSKGREFAPGEHRCGKRELSLERRVAATAPGSRDGRSRRTEPGPRKQPEEPWLPDCGPQSMASRARLRRTTGRVFQAREVQQQDRPAPARGGWPGARPGNPLPPGTPAPPPACSSDTEPGFCLGASKPRRER